MDKADSVSKSDYEEIVFSQAPDYEDNCTRQLHLPDYFQMIHFILFVVVYVAVYIIFYNQFYRLVYVIFYLKLIIYQEGQSFIFMECPICLDSMARAPNVYCTNPACNSRVCIPCFDQLVTFATSNKTLPLCPITGCGGYYYHRNIPSELHTKYAEAVVTHFSAQFDQLILYEINKHDIIEKVRNLRRIYLQDNFPKGIYLAASIALGPKLTRINVAKLKKEKEKPKRKCMNSLCEGVLVVEKDNLVCVACTTHFCQECERRVLPHSLVEHICKPEDVESVKFTRSLMACPKCHTAIEKSEGCNEMTCAFCLHKFNYRTGDDSADGNHGQSKPVEEKEHSFLDNMEPYLKSKEKRDKYEKYITDIEETNPGPPNQTKLIRIIVNYLKGKQKESNDISDTTILSEYCKFFHHRQIYKNYMNVMNEIETLLIQKKLKLSHLKSLWRKIVGLPAA